MPLAVYGLDDGESTKMLFASFEDDDIERVFKTIPSPSNSPFTVKNLGYWIERTLKNEKCSEYTI